MNILEKLRESHVDIEIEAVVSMPIVNSIGEFIFVYYTKPNDSNDSFMLDRIKCIYSFPFDEDNIEIKRADLVFPKELLDRVDGAIIRPTIIGMEAMEKEEQCFILYGKMINSIESHRDRSEVKDLCNEYQSVLFDLIPKSVLREIYEFLLQM